MLVRDDVSDLTLTPLALDEYLFVAPESRGNHPATFAELSEQTFFLPPSKDSGHQRIRAYLVRQGVPLDTLTENAQDSVILSMVAHELGITVMPRLALLPFPPGLIALPLPEPLMRPLALAVLPHRAHLPVVRAFTETLRQTLNAAVTEKPHLLTPRAGHPAHLN